MHFGRRLPTSDRGRLEAGTTRRFPKKVRALPGIEFESILSLNLGMSLSPVQARAQAKLEMIYNPCDSRNRQRGKSPWRN